MTRQIAILRLAAALTLAVAVAPAAEAGGGGVRLNFGGPLPSFVATPTPGYGGSSAPSRHTAQKKVSKPAHQVARRNHDETPKATRTAAKPERQIARSDRAAPKPERHIARVERKVVRQAPAEVQTAALTSDTATDSTTPITGTKSLAFGALPPLEPIAAAELIPAEQITAIEAPDQASAKSEATATTEPAPQVKTAAGPQECKKFIPAVGVTVTVGCNE